MSNNTSKDLEKTACEIVSAGKGLLAADESFGTISRRFSAVGIESTPESRRQYRELLFSTPNIESCISAVILFDETIRQSTADGTPFPRYLERRGIIPGIKVDKGAKPLANFPDEKVSEGLDDLRNRLAEYKSLGARFAKWRAVISIGIGLPSGTCINANSHALARYAALCQEAGLVPIVEPEVLMEGDHDLERCEKTTQAMLVTVFDHLYANRIMFEGMLLKPNMVIPGKLYKAGAADADIAQANVRCLRRTVPASVPGIAFLSGGQDPVQATRNLNAINKAGEHPWMLTFSFSRALQDPVLDKWRGKTENKKAAQEIFLHRARCNSAAARGTYEESMEKTQPGFRG